MAVDRIRHGVVVTANVRENRPKTKLDTNRVFGKAISFPDGLLGGKIKYSKVRDEHVNLCI